MDLKAICEKIGLDLQEDLKWDGPHSPEKIGELALEAVLRAGLTVTDPVNRIEITTDRK